MSMPEATPPPDMSLRDLAQFAEGQARRLAANFGFDPAGRGGDGCFALAQTVKLGEEVGELQAEVLGALELQRREKAGRYSRETLGGEPGRKGAMIANYFITGKDFCTYTIIILRQDKRLRDHVPARRIRCRLRH
jgi:hypothetical protein